MEQFDSSEEESSRVLEQQQRNDEQQCPSCAAELTETNARVPRTSDRRSHCTSMTICDDYFTAHKYATRTSRYSTTPSNAIAIWAGGVNSSDARASCLRDAFCRAQFAPLIAESVAMSVASLSDVSDGWWFNKVATANSATSWMLTTTPTSTDYMSGYQFGLQYTTVTTLKRSRPILRPDVVKYNTSTSLQILTSSLSAAEFCTGYISTVRARIINSLYWLSLCTVYSWRAEKAFRLKRFTVVTVAQWTAVYTWFWSSPSERSHSQSE